MYNIGLVALLMSEFLPIAHIRQYSIFHNLWNSPFSDANWRSNSQSAPCIKYIENSAYLPYVEWNPPRIDLIF